MKLLSLFSGSGGFELAGAMCGIVPVAASEIEPYPIAVTKSRFPNMIHLGNVCNINGAEIEPTDVVCFGFPCQDVSVAGKRASVKHEDNGDEETTRSGLVWEAIRIIKEMRGATNGEYPRFAVFENVPGLFSAEKGEAFRTVVEGLIKVVEPNAVMPKVPKKGWAYADCYIGDGWSFAYRVFDSQYIRTAQRRRRVYAILDLRGQCAGQVLFERESLRGYPPQSGTPWQGVATDAEGSVGADDREGAIPYTLKIRSGVSVDSYGKAAGKGPLVQENLSATLGASQDQYLFQPVCLGVDIYNQSLTGDKTKTLNSAATDSDHVPCVIKEQHLFENHSQDTRYKGPLDVCPMLPAQLGTGGNNTPFVVEQPIALDRAFFNQGKNALYEPQFYEDGTNPTIVAKGPSAVCTRYIVRRLTPTECARLQGFPDTWGHIDQKDDFTEEEYEFWLNVRNTHAEINGKAVKDYTKKQMLTWYNKLHTDSAEYKLWGNGIALPCALYVMQGIADVLKGENLETH